MVARVAEEDKDEVMDDRVGSGDAREARARYMVPAGAVRVVSGTAWGRAGLTPGQACLDRVTGVTGATGCLFPPGWRSCLEYLLGRYDDLWVLGSLGLLPLGLGLGLPWFVQGWLHAVCSGQWMQDDPEFDTGQFYGTVWQLSDGLAVVEH